ncbi:transcription antiterminator [Sebaldella sp. S0638]|uniref:BglG family transcription antiterminator n=1 Tax=Sebaldella sp. S0638 TaxID=2957809 RepID=UPI00209E513C|nr:PTS sugar transporter subunit IIA [Sebaldella sp. S0638]MCP1223199.1 PTS sugar transporter subunit IIA [Sebaldella sp. S0638]
MKNLVKKIIRTLLDVHDYITADELARIVNVSISSIKHNIKDVREELKKHDIELLSIPRKGFCLDIDNSQRALTLQEIDNANSPDSFSFRKNYILDTLFQYNSIYTIQLFADELYVSRSIIRKDLQYITNILERHDLALIKKRNFGIIIDGNEFNIRQAMIEHNIKKYSVSDSFEPPENLDRRLDSKKYSYFKNTYENIDMSKILTAVQKLEEELNITFADDSFYQLLEYITVSLIRIKNEKFITNPIPKSSLGINEACFIAAQNLFRHIFKTDINELELESAYLAARLMVYRTCTNYIFTSNKYYKSIAKKFISGIGSVIGETTLPQKNHLIRDIAAFYEIIKFRNDYQIIIWNDIHHDIKERFASLYGMCLAQLHDIETELNVDFTQDDVAWIVLLIHNTIVETVKSKEAVLITASDKQTSRYMANKLMEKIMGLDVKEISHYKNFKMKKSLKAPLVITTVALDINNSAFISKEVNEHDIELVQKKIGEKFYDEIISSNIFEEVFHRELVLCDLYAKDKKDAISKICNLMMEKGYVSDGFVEKVLERENKTPTSIGSQIAIPHVFKDCVKKTAIAAVRLKYPVLWCGEDKVKIILLMALDINSKNKMKKLLQKLYTFIDNPEKQVHLLDVENSEEMFQVLLKQN